MKNGKYTLIIAPDNYPGKKYRDRYAYEHTVKYWKANGSVPGPGMEIHHINGDHRDNRIKNLKLVTSMEHRKIHAEVNRVHPHKYDCDNCGKEHQMAARNYRYKWKAGQRFFFCSTKCQALLQHSFGGKLRD
jgi:hypothetical protein